MEKEFNTSKSNVYLYLRLNHLITQLMDALDNKKLNIKVAAELSYNTVKNEVKRGTVLLYNRKRKYCKAYECEPCVLTSVEHKPWRPLSGTYLPSQK